MVSRGFVSPAFLVESVRSISKPVRKRWLRNAKSHTGRTQRQRSSWIVCAKYVWKGGDGIED